MADKTSIADTILKRKKDPELQKQLQSEQIDFEETVEKVDEAKDIVKKSKLQQRILEKKKKRKKFYIALPFIIVISYIVNWFYTPYYAGLDYGFCKVFLELNVQYPEHLVLSEVEEKREFVRIWYMQTDSFGQQRLENIECYHGEDPERGYYISKVMIDRRELDPERVEKFNTSLSTLVAYPPDLAYPVRLRDALGNVDIKTYLYRKPIF